MEGKQIFFLCPFSSYRGIIPRHQSVVGGQIQALIFHVCNCYSFAASVSTLEEACKSHILIIIFHYDFRFAAALKDLKVWVMNVVPINSPDTLPIIYERGLFGIYHDWCESFSTYPRSYDLVHVDHLFSDLKKRYLFCIICSLCFKGTPKHCNH